jgi:uncharacterized membrane protein YsdA (DUF1294 family)
MAESAIVFGWNEEWLTADCWYKKTRKQRYFIPYLTITNDALLVYLLKEKTAGETVQHACGSLLVKCG